MKSRSFKSLSIAAVAALTLSACAKNAEIEVDEETIAAAQAEAEAIVASITAAGDGGAYDANEAAASMSSALEGSGITVISTELVGNGSSSGSFVGATSNIGFASGIILSTGKVTDLFQPASSLVSTSFDTACTDPDLDAISVEALFDCSILNMVVRPSGNLLKISFVFGSEEYPEYVNQYNDVFGLFITGPNPSGGEYTAHNFAKVPNTNDVVSINNIHAGKNSSYYLDNNGAGSELIVLDGMTVVMTATVAVTPGEDYTLKFGISDAYDSGYDSAVFIKASSLISE